MKVNAFNVYLGAVFLKIDSFHRLLLLTYVLNVKYPKKISSIEEHAKKSIKYSKRTEKIVTESNVYNTGRHTATAEL